MNVVCYECYVISQFLLLIKNGKQSMVVFRCPFYVISISLNLFYRVTYIDFVGTKICVWEWKYIFIFRLVSRHPTSSNAVISQDGGDKSSSATGPRELTPRIRIHKGPPTPLAARAAAYQALTRPTVTRTAPLVWPSHFKGLETEASDPSPSFKFSLPDKIKVPEFRSNSSGKTQNASSNSPSDPEASSNNKIPVIFRFSSPTPSSQISSKAVPDRTSSKFPFPSICPWFFKSTANPVSTSEVTASSVSVDAVKPSDTGNIFSSLLSRHPASPHLHNEPMNSSDEPIFGKSLNILKENC